MNKSMKDRMEKPERNQMKLQPKESSIEVMGSQLEERWDYEKQSGVIMIEEAFTIGNFEDKEMDEIDIMQSEVEYGK
jgi:hypothetical protein